MRRRQAAKVILGWSTARVIAIPRRPLQCFKSLELGHVRATCVSAVNRRHLCYRCGESGYRARGCPASAPKCPLCESLGAPANHRMGGVACAPPENQEETTRPRASGGGKNARQHRRSSRRWPGGGHGVGPMNSRGSSRVTWEGRDGRKTCSSRLSGRARSPSRWWLSRIASLTRPTGSGIWMDWQP